MFTFYKYITMFLYMFSMFPWFTWNTPSFFYVSVGFVGSVCFYLIKKKEYFLCNRKNLLPLILLLAAFFFYVKGFTFIGMSEQFMLFICVALVINLKDEYKVEVVDFITKSMAWIVGLSLVFYLINLSGVPLPSSPIPTTKLGYSGTNYYFFTVPDELTFVFRFRSIFAEPGHLTMGVIPLLFINKFNIRNRNILILIIAELFTISLAGFVAMSISLFMYGFSPRVKRIKYWLAIVAVSVVAYVMMDTVRENNTLNVGLVSRLTINDSKGTIAGYNRTNEYVDIFFSNFITNSESLLGLGYEAAEIVTEGSAGYKVYLIRFGIISSVLVFLLYLVYALNYKSYEVMCFFILTMIMLYQNAYPFWFSVASSFFLGIPKLKLQSISKMDNRLTTLCVECV